MGKMHSVCGRLGSPQPIYASGATMKAAIGFTFACWLSGAILILVDSTAAIALSGALALAGLDLFAP